MGQVKIASMTKTELLQEISRARKEFLEALDGLSDEAKRRPGACGIWSIKDLFAHLAAWESELITAINQVKNGQKPAIIDIEDTHEWNDEQYHANAPRPLDVVEADFHGVHRQLIQVIEDLDEKILFDRWKYKWMEGEPFAYLIQELAPWHEQEHIEDILIWRAENNL